MRLPCRLTTRGHATPRLPALLTASLACLPLLLLDRLRSAPHRHRQLHCGAAGRLRDRPLLLCVGMGAAGLQAGWIAARGCGRDPCLCTRHKPMLREAVCGLWSIALACWARAGLGTADVTTAVAMRPWQGRNAPASQLARRLSPAAWHEELAPHRSTPRLAKPS